VSDFLDRFGSQLYAAQAPASRRVQGRLARRLGLTSLPRPRRRDVLLAAIVLAVAAPAVALVAPWHPALERSGIDRPVGVDTSPVVASASDALAVLRRPQTEDDRRLAAPLLTTVGSGNQIDGVQTDGIRSLADGWALVPAKSVATGPGKTTSDVICLTNGRAIGCTPADSVSTEGAGFLSASSTSTSLAGVVPDGVARVRFTPDEAPPVEARVTSNFYSLSVRQTAPSATVKAPPGYKGPAEIPGPPMPAAGTVQWLDDKGQVIGPAQQRLG
jgi:hypothetical protein